jgi:hypothetical protein
MLLLCCEASYAGGLVVPGNKSGSPDGNAFGIVQMSGGLHVEKFRRSVGRQRFTELNKADVHRISSDLERAFSPDKQFRLEGLGAGPQSSRLAHTWMGEWSRHQPVDMPSIFFPPDYAGHGYPDIPEFPDALNWPERQPEETQKSTYVRLQRVVEETGPNNYSDRSDYNDRIVTYKGAQGDAAEIAPCDQIRNFFAWLYAQRRCAIYASNLSERIYHIWLPGGLLSPAGRSQNEMGPLVILPLVTMVRRPHQLAWRHTIGITIFFVPVECGTDGRLSPRPLIRDGSVEIELLTRSLEGGSTGLRPSGKSQLFLDDCPFKEYVAALMGTTRRPSVIPGMRSMIDRWEGTPRQWIELSFALAADAVGRWDTTPDLHRRRLSDAVLRSLRQTAIWSVTVSGPGLDPLEDRDDRLWPVRSPSQRKPAVFWSRFGRQAPRPSSDQTAQWLNDFPAWARNVLLMLSDPGPLPHQNDRVDDVSCIDVDFMTWRIPRRRCLLTMMGISNENFPRSSLLYIFGWIGHMVIAAASTTETMLELGREIDQPLPVAQLADTAYQFILELEEMYDLDTTWLIFTRFFRNIRKSLGIDEQYQGIRERVELLARNAEVNERIRTERETVEVTIIGAILAIVLIALAALSVPELGPHWDFRITFIGGAIMLVLLIIVYRFVRSKRRWLRKLR